MSETTTAPLSKLIGKPENDLENRLKHYRDMSPQQPWYMIALFTGAGWFAAFCVTGTLFAFLYLVLELRSGLPVLAVGSVALISGFTFSTRVAGEMVSAFANAIMIGGWIVCLLYLFSEDYRIAAAIAGGVFAVISLWKLNDPSQHFISLAIWGGVLSAVAHHYDGGDQWMTVVSIVSLPLGIWLLMRPPKGDWRGWACLFLTAAIVSGINADSRILFGVLPAGTLPWAGQVSALVAVSYLLWQTRHQIDAKLLAAFWAVGLVTALLLPNAALCGYALILFGAFAGYQALAVIGTAVSVLAVSRFYYDLDVTLLLKSGMLFMSGLFLLLVWRYWTTQRELEG